MNKININEKIVQFENSLKANKRLVFSAPFGDGKTYFLKEYQRRHKDTVVIKLRPINYSVAPNEDVFEYIKRDILCQLCRQGLIMEENVITILKSVFNKDNFKDVAGLALSLVSGGMFIKKGMETMDDAVRKRESYDNYMSMFAQQKGGLYENDAYTEMIREALEQSKKESLLIIDDLDRLDPGHLFRILNVISAHIDEEEDKNKFGFTYIVMAMDYMVTEHIFHHFYGEGANYEGYMRKFSAAPPFYYSITDLAREQLKMKVKANIKGIDINKFPHFVKRLNSLRVREYKELIDIKIAERMVPTPCMINGVEFDTCKFPLFPLLIYMNAVGMSEREVIEDFNPENWQDSITTYIKLMSPLYLKKNKSIRVVSKHENGVYHEFVKGLKKIDGVSNKIYEEVSGQAVVYKFDVEKESAKLMASHLSNFSKAIIINDWKRGGE